MSSPFCSPFEVLGDGLRLAWERFWGEMRRGVEVVFALMWMQGGAGYE
jgi:hypothetical protein